MTKLNEFEWLQDYETSQQTNKQLEWVECHEGEDKDQLSVE